VPHTFTQLTYHAVFGTKGRLPQIGEDLRARLYPYLGALINNNQAFARQIGGMPDHLHILFDLHQTVAVADFLRELKSVSSGWVHQAFPELLDFGWQGGYGAFTVSASRIARVKRYILNQHKDEEARQNDGGKIVQAQSRLLLSFCRQ
jgi:REP element-mobilizing transposase RayT